MIPSIIAIGLAFYWLLIETDYMRVRLPYGKDRPRYGVGRTLAGWEQYEKDHAKELAKEREEYAKRQAHIKAHTCPICRTLDESRLIETKTIIVGNSTANITACPTCLAKIHKDIVTSQKGITRQPVIKTTQLPLFVEQVRVGSHREWIETTPKHGYHNTVTEYKTVFSDCLPGKEWLKAHYKDEYPEPTIELNIDGKTLSLNGNFKKGMIKEFVKSNKGV